LKKISSVLHQVRVIFKKFISDLSLLQQISGKLISFSTIRHNVILSSSPKAGICSKRSNLHISSFLRFAPVLWIIDKHCNKLIDPATNKYAEHTPAVYLTLHFTGFLQLVSDCKILTRKRNKLASNFCERTVFRKEMFWLKEVKRIFICYGPTDVPKYEKNLLSFGETRGMKFNGHFPKLMLSNAFLYGLLCSRIRQKQYCNKCVWYAETFCQTAHFFIKFQVKLFLFQWFGPVFLSSSSPKKVSVPTGVIFISHHSWDLFLFCESLTNTATKL